MEEPACRKLYDFSERARFLKEVGSVRDDLELGFAMKPMKGGAVECEDIEIGTTDNEKGRRLDMGKRAAGKIRPPAPRNDGGDMVPRPRCGDESRGGPGTRSEIADGQCTCDLGALHPFSRFNQPGCEKCDIEHICSISGFALTEEIEQEGCEP